MNTNETNLVALAKNIASFMPEVERVDVEHPHCPRLHLKSGGSFIVRLDNYRNPKMATVSGNFHIDTKQSDGKSRSEYYGDRLYTPDNRTRLSVPSMSFNAFKETEVIVKDIRRRFLKDYVNLYALAVKSAAGHSDYADKTVNTKIALAKACGNHGADTLPAGNEISCHIGELSLGFRVSDNRAEVRINTYLPEEKVLKLIAFLKTL